MTLPDSPAGCLSAALERAERYAIRADLSRLCGASRRGQARRLREARALLAVHLRRSPNDAEFRHLFTLVGEAAPNEH